MNVYSNSSHSALKYFKDTEVNINNVLLMMGDFNIRNSLWDPSFPFHSFISDNLIVIADSFLSDHCLSSDHAPLLIDILIIEEIIHMSKLTITPKSEQETKFINDIISNFKKLETSNIEDITNLE